MRRNFKTREQIDCRMSKKEILEYLFVTQAGRCRYCKRECVPTDGKILDEFNQPDNLFTLDHIYPQKSGGRLTINNVVGACRECNLNKGAMMMKKFVELELWKEENRKRLNWNDRRTKTSNLKKREAELKKFEKDSNEAFQDRSESYRYEFREELDFYFWFVTVFSQLREDLRKLIIL